MSPLRRLQSMLAGLYDAPVEHDVGDFLLCDRRKLRETVGAHADPDSDEQVFVIEDEQGIRLGVYIDERVLARLDRHDPTQSLDDGNLADYWEIFRKERLLQGGFIWDWKDQGLFRRIHALDAAEDRSGKGHTSKLFGVLSKEEGVFNGGVIVDEADDLDLTGAVTLVAEARGNFGGARAQGGGDNNRNESDGYPIVSKGDNIPIVAMLFIVAFFMGWGIREAGRNDRLIKNGRRDEILKDMQR